MVRLMLMLFVMIATVLMGVGIVAVLAMGLDTMQPIVLAAVAGFAAAIPVAWLVTRQILKGQQAV